MKHKNLLFLLLLLFIPTFVLAADQCNAGDIQIKSIQLVDQKAYATELSEPTFTGNQVYLDLNLFDVNDSLSYEIVIKNQSKEDFVIDNDLFGGSDYVQYHLVFPNDNNIIAPGKEKKVRLDIVYAEKVPVSAFQDDAYEESNTVLFNLTNGDKLTNPITSPNLMIAVVAILVCMVTVLLSYKKKVKMMAFVIGMLILPFCVNALCTTSVAVKANVLIENCTYKFITDRGSFSLDSDVQMMCVNDMHFDYTYQVARNNCSGSADYCASFVSVDLSSFRDDSYIKVYDLNHVLIDTITKEKLPVNLYKIDSDFFLYDRDASFVYDVNVEVEAYNLSDTDYSIGYYFDTPSYVKYTGTWISRQSDLRKLYNFRDSLVQLDQFCFDGFYNTHDNIYEAQFACHAQ